jgi:hypothetical protein
MTQKTLPTTNRRCEAFNGCPHHMGPGRPSDLKGTFQVNLWGAEGTFCDVPRAHVQYIYIYMIWYDIYICISISIVNIYIYMIWYPYDIYISIYHDTKKNTYRYAYDICIWYLYMIRYLYTYFMYMISICLSVCLPACLPGWLPVCMYVRTYVCM